MLYDDNTATLQISCGEARHGGEYMCVATNSVGSASCRAKLTLQGQYLWRNLLAAYSVPDFSPEVKSSLLLLLCCCCCCYPC